MHSYQMVISMQLTGPYITTYKTRELAQAAKERAHKRAAFAGVTIRIRKHVRN